MRKIEINEFADLWPEAKRAQVKKLFDDIDLMGIDAGEILSASDATRVFIGQSLPPQEICRVLGVGAEFIIQHNRDDFAFSLFTAGLIAKNRKVFFQNPLPFLFRSYVDGITEQKISQQTFFWKQYEQKSSIIDHAMKFLEGFNRLKPYRASAAQLLDELISNASPPAGSPGDDLTRQISIAYSPDRICFVCRDHQPSFPEQLIRQKLHVLSMEDQLRVRSTETGGGIGIPIMIELSSNFFLCHQDGGGGVAATLIDVRKGLRDLEEVPKNAHIFKVR